MSASNLNINTEIRNAFVDGQIQIALIQYKVKSIPEPFLNKTEDWNHDEMLLPEGREKMNLFKVLAAGIIQTVHKELIEKRNEKFTLKRNWKSALSIAQLAMMNGGGGISHTLYHMLVNF